LPAAGGDTPPHMRGPTMRLDLTRIQIDAVAAMLADALEDDERAYLDCLEGETDLYEWVRRLLERIEEDQGVIAALAEQIADRQVRELRATDRIDANREAIMALLQCARLDKLTLPEATLSVRRMHPKPIVTDEAAVPDDFCKVTRRPDMAAIKAGVEAGAAVPGVSFDNGGNSLTIRRK
jgi:hypothetical protein